MSEVPVQVIVAAFQDPNGASAALEQLKEQQSQGTIKIEDAAILTKDAEGKLHIKETADMGGGKGAVVGGIIGGVIGILAGPAGIAAGAAAGAVVGGLVAKLHDAGFPDERLREIGAGLKPNTSAIVALVDHVWVAEAERQMQEAGAETMTAALSADIAKQLAEGKEVAYSAVATDEAMGMTRVTGDKDEAEVSAVVATQDAVYMEDVAKKGDDVTVATGVVTEEGAVVVEGTGKVTEGDGKAEAEPPKAEAPAPPVAAPPEAPAAPAA